MEGGGIDAGDFERLLYVLLSALDGFQNVQWLMHSNAADRGRDLSVERVLTDGSGMVRTERVIVQAKHWLSKSVGVDEISTNVAQMKLWEPPLVDGLIVATSGRFTTDAVSWVENHNQRGVAPPGSSSGPTVDSRVCCPVTPRSRRSSSCANVTGPLARRVREPKVRRS